ncbi:MAG: hypothetical protein CMJ69_17945 [Planctomycetaceae bacterium]|nr:hypothetical protein [Planctomycetaceae bacterium]|tara:strand:+ start:956 stop:1264 length:309 start_codon:yes stop_codon:yes gene_type:complete
MAKKKTTKKATKKAAKKITKSVAKKKAAKKTTRKKKSTEPKRYRLIWGVYSSGMREESRFDYGKRKDADKKAEQLTAKGKKLFWVQPIKEEIVPEPEVPEDE